MNKTSIEWTHRPGTIGMTWNPIHAHSDRLDHRGKLKTGNFCTKISPGCANCYAARINIARGNGLEYSVRYLDHAKFYLDEKELATPLRQKRPCTIFVGDMFDLFHEAIPDHMISQVFAIMAASYDHTFQLLTKRADRMQRFLAQFKDGKDACEAIGFPTDEHGGVPDWCEYTDEFSCFVSNSISGALGPHGVGWPMKNVWLGVSVESQKYADERIPLLLQTPAAVRFLSVEPLLEAVNLREHFKLPLSPAGDIGISWAIVGGESGPGARPFHLSWAESIRQQCRDYNVACFIKQLGSRPTIGSAGLRYVAIKDRKGGDMSEWPEDLRVREFPA